MQFFVTSRAHAGLLALAVTVASCSPSLQEVYDVLPAIGDPVPEFEYTGIDGSAVTPESLRGKPAVIALWSTTCSASREALASLGALHAEYAGEGARVVILAEDSDASAVSTVLAASKVQVPVALASGTLQDTFTHDQSVFPWRQAFALPTILVLNRDGKVVLRQLGVERDSTSRLKRVRSVLDSLAASQ